MRAFVLALFALVSAALAQTPVPIAHTNPIAGQQFGRAFSIGGVRMAISAPSDFNAPASAVYAYELVGGTWTAVQTITPPEPSAGGWFGAQVVLDAPSQRLAVASMTNVGIGKVYIYERSAGAWQLAANITPPGLFGFIGPLALQGDTLVVGNSSFHAVLVLRRQVGGNWTMAQTFNPQSVVGHPSFGANVALSGDMLVVSSHDEAVNAPNSPVPLPLGQVYVYTRPNAASNFAFAFTIGSYGGAPALRDDFGERIALSSKWLAIASQTLGQGYIEVFPRVGNSLTPNTGLFAPALAAPVRALALRDDQLLVGGAPHSELFEYDSAAPAPGWVSTALLATPNPSANAARALHFDETAAYVADYGQNNSAGEVFEFPPVAGLRRYCEAKVSSQNCVPKIQWSGAPSVSGATSFSVSAIQIVPQRDGILIYGFQPASTPFIGGLLCLAAPRRTQVTNSGVAVPCGGVLSTDFGALVQSGVDPALGVGVETFAQWWYRDPAATPLHGLSDALRMLIQP